jgi:hypothetical protein
VPNVSKDSTPSLASILYFKVANRLFLPVLYIISVLN